VKYLLRASALLLIVGSKAFAVTVTPFNYAVTAPSYGDSVFDGLTSTLVDGALFFGVVAVIAVLITGFFKGRSWLRRV